MVALLRSWAGAAEDHSRSRREGVARACPGMASLEADAPSGGGREGATELNYSTLSGAGGQKYPGNEAFVALVKAYGATLTKIDLR